MNNEIQNKKYHTFRIALQSKTKVVETGKTDAPNTYT